jgi:hypothetical protein
MASYEFSDAIPGNSSTKRTVHFIFYTQFITDEANKTVGATWVKRTFPDSLLRNETTFGIHRDTSFKTGQATTLLFYLSLIFLSSF